MTEEKNFEIRRSGQDNYLVLFPERKKVPLFELNYLSQGTIIGFLPVETMIHNGRLEMWYRLTGCNSLRTLLKIGQIGEKEIRRLFDEVVTFSQILEENLMNSIGVVLDIDGIFFSEEKKSYLFTYNPEEDVDLKARLLGLVEELLTLVDYKKQELISYLYAAYEILGQDNVDYRMLKDIKESRVMTETETETVTAEVAGKELVQIDNSPFYQEDFVEEKVSFLYKIQRNIQEMIDERVGDWKKKVKSKVDIYTDFRPVLINPQDADIDHPTVLLGTLVDEHREKTFCLTSNHGEEIVLNKEKIVLGKAKEKVDELVDEVGVSRLHAFIIKEEDNYYLEDLNSLNGTYINGERLNYKERVCLKENDQIGIGTRTFSFRAI